MEIDLATQIVRRDPVEAILDQAAGFSPDLIILGAHGEPRLRDVLFGTTAMRVARLADQPVLIARNDPRTPYRVVLAALDEDGAEDVLRLACGIASLTELFAVHAVGSIPTDIAGDVGVIEDVRESQKAAVERIVAGRAGGALPAKVHHIVEAGDPVEVLLRICGAVKPDLAVFGTHGRRGLQLLFEGSVAGAAMLGCETDILVMRHGARPAALP